MTGKGITTEGLNLNRHRRTISQWVQAKIGVDAAAWNHIWNKQSLLLVRFTKGEIRFSKEENKFPQLILLLSLILSYCKRLNSKAP
ncbi:hypothetical protein Dimus_013597 [Dionaea muscipula]